MTVAAFQAATPYCGSIVVAADIGASAAFTVIGIREGNSRTRRNIVGFIYMQRLARDTDSICSCACMTVVAFEIMLAMGVGLTG